MAIVFNLRVKRSIVHGKSDTGRCSSRSTSKLLGQMHRAVMRYVKTERKGTEERTSTLVTSIQTLLNQTRHRRMSRNRKRVLTIVLQLRKEAYSHE